MSNKKFAAGEARLRYKELRASGLTNAKIIETMGISRSYAKSLVTSLLADGEIESRVGQTDLTIVDRDAKIMQMVSAGKPLIMIAKDMGIEYNTIKNILYRLRKNALKNREATV